MTLEVKLPTGEAVSLSTEGIDSVASLDAQLRSELGIPGDATIHGLFHCFYGPLYPLDVVVSFLKAFIECPNAVYTVICLPNDRDTTQKNGGLAEESDALPGEPGDANSSGMEWDYEELRRGGTIGLQQARAFLKSLHAQGFTKFRAPPRIAMIIDDMVESSRNFFQCAKEEKEHCSWYDGGYSLENNKDIFHMHRSHLERDIIWPKDTKRFPHFRETMSAYWRAMHEVATTLLEAVSIALFKRPDMFNEVLEDGESKPWSFATSCRVFQYNNPSSSRQQAQQCKPHADTSLLTVSPCSTQPELEIVHRTRREWIYPELACDQHDILVFCGSYLSYLTNGLLLPSLHRVLHQKPYDVQGGEGGEGGGEDDKGRISAPFFLRPRSNAQLVPVLGASISPTTGADGVESVGTVTDANTDKDVDGNEYPTTLDFIKNFSGRFPNIRPDD